MLLFLVLLVSGLGLISGVGGQTPETAPPLFIVGRTYLVMPTILAGELLTVTRVRVDGWVETTDEDGEAWMLNPAQVYAMKLMPMAGQQASR